MLETDPGHIHHVHIAQKMTIQCATNHNNNTCLLTLDVLLSIHNAVDVFKIKIHICKKEAALCIVQNKLFCIVRPLS